MRTKLLWIAALLASPCLAAAQVVYGGSSTFADTVLKDAVKGFETKSGVKVQIADTSGTGKGLKSLAEGKVNLVGSGRVLNAEEKKSGLLGTIIGYDGLAVYVHRSNPVKDLSKEQLKGIFTGKFQNWKEVGGSDNPILITLAKLNPATNTTFRNQILDGEPYTKDIAETGTTDEIKQFVAGSPESIAFATRVRIFATCAASARAADLPITTSRTELCPTRVATLTSEWFRSMPSRNTPISTAEVPQLPVITVVTPCKTKFQACSGPCVGTFLSICVWTSMNPGASTRPCALM